MSEGMYLDKKEILYGLIIIKAGTQFQWKNTKKVS